MDIFEGKSVEVKREGRGVLSGNRYLYAEENLLGSGPVTGLIGKFAVPSVIGMLVNAIYSITDQIFIGHAVDAHDGNNDIVCGSDVQYADFEALRNDGKHISLRAVISVNRVKALVQNLLTCQLALGMMDLR